MYCAHVYGLHLYCALVELDSSSSPGVSLTPGLTLSTKVACVCARAYTSTHPPTTLRVVHPARITLLHTRLTELTPEMVQALGKQKDVTVNSITRTVDDRIVVK